HGRANDGCEGGSAWVLSGSSFVSAMFSIVVVMPAGGAVGGPWDTAGHASGLPPRPGRRLLQPRRLRRVPGRGLRRVPAPAARARARPDRLLRPPVRGGHV